MAHPSNNILGLSFRDLPLDSSGTFAKLATMGDFYTLQTIDQMPGDMDRYGVIGYPIIHSLSPFFQQAAFDSLGILARYVRIEVKPGELPAMVSKLKEMNFKGWNCTLPHKVELASLVDESDITVQKLKSVNTVLNHGGKLTGISTDGPGWARAIREEFSADVHNLRIMILGIGGAGRAVATEAALQKCKRLVLVNRTVEKAQELSGELADVYPTIEALPLDEKRLEAEIPNIDLIVNCTSAGLKKDAPSILPERILKKHLMVYDTIYNPARTQLIEAANAVGAATANGLSMLLHQGILSFEFWTKTTAPSEKMREALYSAASQL